MLEPGAAGLVERSGDAYGHHLVVVGAVLHLDRTGPVRAPMVSTRVCHGRQSGHSRGELETMTSSTPAASSVRMWTSVAARPTAVRTAISA